MQKLRKPWRVISLVVLGLILGEGIYLARTPDETLVLDRKLRSRLTPERIDRNLSSTTRWSQWFSSLAQVQGPAEVKIGTVVTLKIDPKKGQRKRFELQAQVLDYVPARLLRLRITDDTSGRLTRLFDNLEWTIEIEPTAKGSSIRGIAQAHTRHWRSRLFGRLAEKILMNQVFYPNLIQLADREQPYTVDEAPHQPESLY